MALTAREWLLLPKDEMEARKGELSKEECAKLRLELDAIHFTEEEKVLMTNNEKYRFTHPENKTDGEKERFNKATREIFIKMQEEVKNMKEDTIS